MIVMLSVKRENKLLITLLITSHLHQFSLRWTPIGPTLGVCLTRELSASESQRKWQEPTMCVFQGSVYHRCQFQTVAVSS